MIYFRSVQHGSGGLAHAFPGVRYFQHPHPVLDADGCCDCHNRHRLYPSVTQIAPLSWAETISAITLRPREGFRWNAELTPECRRTANEFGHFPRHLIGALIV